MKNKNQKLVSRIICGMLVSLVLFLNAGASMVAYAATPPTPTPAASPGLDCKTGFVGSFEETPDHQYCKKDSYLDGDKCGPKFHINKTDSIKGDGSVGSKSILFCAPDSSVAPVDSKVIGNGIAVIAGVQRGLNRLIWPVLVLIGGLMGNDLLFGNGMEEKLRDVWIPIRNLVNILFVIVLVGLALYNVLGLADDNTSIKSMLPKIVIGIIAVNFSFLAIKVVLDGINVMTTAVFALPDQVGSGLGTLNIEQDNPRLCAALEGTPFARFEDMGDDLLVQQREKAIYVEEARNEPYKGAGVLAGDSIDSVNGKIETYVNSEAGKAKGGTSDDFKKKVASSKKRDLCKGRKLSDSGMLFLSHYNSRNAAFALALNMGKIVFYNDIDTKSLGDGTDALEKLFTNSLFSMILYIIYCVSFIALFIVLLGRLVVMWLSIAVSPILLLMIASPQVKEKMGGFSKLSEQFTKNAIAPLLIALSMTVGWIMLKAVQGLQLSTSLDGSLLNINPSNGIPVASLNTLQDFIVALGVIAVVWMGVFSAADGTIAEGATKWIKGAVEKAGSFVGQIPFKNLPLIPIALPGHLHDSYTFSQLGNYIESIGREKDIDKLTTNAGGDKQANEGNLKNYRDEAGLKNWLVNAKKGSQDLSDEKYRAPIKDWLTANKTEADRIRSSGVKGKALITDMETLRDSYDDKARKKAAVNINKNEILSGIKGELEPPKTTVTPPAAPAAPAKGAKPAADPAEDFIRKKGSDGKPDPKDKTEGDKRVAKVKTSKDVIANAADYETVKGEVGKIGAQIKGARKTPPTDEAGLKVLFGDSYGRVKGVYKDDDAIITALGGTPAPKVAAPTPATPAQQTPPPAPAVKTPAAPIRPAAAEPIKVEIAATTRVIPQAGAGGGATTALPKTEGTPGNLASANPIDVKKDPDKPTV